MTAAAARALSSLLRALQTELQCGRRLLAIQKGMAEACADHDPARVQALEAGARTLLADLERGEQERAGAARALAEALGLPAGEEAALSRLVPLLPPGEGRKLLALRSEIVGLEIALRASGDRAARLLENGAACCRATVEAITRIALRPAKYGAGQAAAGPPALYLDSSA